MTIFPLIKGQIELKTTKEEFISKLNKLTEKDYPLIRPTSVSYDEDLKDYAREQYENSFMLWKIPSQGMKLSPFLFTTIHGHFVEIGGQLLLKYHIRFNIWSNFLVLAIIISTVYLLYSNIFLSDHFDVLPWLVTIIPYPLFMWNYNSCASDDKEFIRKLTV